MSFPMNPVYIVTLSSSVSEIVPFTGTARWTMVTIHASLLNRDAGHIAKPVLVGDFEALHSG